MVDGKSHGGDLIIPKTITIYENAIVYTSPACVQIEMRCWAGMAKKILQKRIMLGFIEIHQTE